MNKNEYKCVDCGGVFEYGWTEEEAQQERIDNGWVDIPMSGMAVVCDDCYKKIMQRFN